MDRRDERQGGRGLAEGSPVTPILKGTAARLGLRKPDRETVPFEAHLNWMREQLGALFMLDQIQAAGVVGNAVHEFSHSTQAKVETLRWMRQNGVRVRP
jgi:hypothetical protein